LNALNYSLILEHIKKVIRNFLKMQPQNVQELLKAEEKAFHLFDVAEKRGLIVADKTEKQLNEELYALAFELLAFENFGTNV
jgi:siroheme synthase (precorrin-2 oxidase/ferrochelatase)